MTQDNQNTSLDNIMPDLMFDGGDLDCGSGLSLLIRENILKVPVGGVLEMRSRDATVKDDLPPWCRLASHEYLGHLDGDGFARYFIRRGRAKSASENGASDEEALKSDKDKAMEYEWRLRIRSTGHQKSTVYCRNFSWNIGQPISFEEKDEHPCSIEAFLGALGGALASGFATECSREGLDIDDIEITARGRLNNVLAHLGVEEGDPSFSSVEIKCFASTMDDETKVRQVWEQTVRRSPIAATLTKATDMKIKLMVV